MRSAVIPSALSYPAVRLAPQPVHQRCVPPGPLVLGRAPRKSRTPAADRDRTVSRRSKPSSRTALNGEQPYPWDLLQPQDPLSHGPSTRDHRITMADFRLCSSCRSRSQAGLCHCTPQLISDQPEPTIARLRYALGGDRPSQTTRHAGSRTQLHGPRLDAREHKGGISRLPPPQLAPRLHRLPPILHISSLTPLQSCSKGARGLSV